MSLQTVPTAPIEPFLKKLSENTTVYVLDITHYNAVSNILMSKQQDNGTDIKIPDNFLPFIEALLTMPSVETKKKVIRIMPLENVSDRIENVFVYKGGIALIDSTQTPIQISMKNQYNPESPFTDARTFGEKRSSDGKITFDDETAFQQLKNNIDYFKLILKEQSIHFIAFNKNTSKISMYKELK